VRFVHEDFDDADAFGKRQRGILAGGSARHEEVNTGVNLPPPQPPYSFLVEVTGFRERRDEGGSNAGPPGSHDAPHISTQPVGRLKPAPTYDRET
jgi:hypothetical protein